MYTDPIVPEQSSASRVEFVTADFVDVAVVVPPCHLSLSPPSLSLSLLLLKPNSPIF